MTFPHFVDDIWGMMQKTNCLYYFELPRLIICNIFVRTAVETGNFAFEIAIEYQTQCVFANIQWFIQFGDPVIKFWIRECSHN